jgi:hypothetical protein
MVTETIQFVERACRDNGASPDDLPLPSRRAYAFLKRLDLEAQPALSAAAEDRRPKRIRLSKLVSACRGFQLELAAQGAELASREGRWGAQEGLGELHARLSALAEMVDEILEQADAQASALPDPSLRAYQWLKYLSDASAFREHVRSPARLYALQPEAHIELYNISGLFRSRTQ